MPDGVKLMKNWQTSSTRMPGNKKRIIVLLALLMPVSALLSICLGSVRISPLTVFQSIFAGKADTVEANIILLARLPRTCGCLLAGAALAVSGAVIQSVLANPLAAPNIIGVSSGAGLAVTAVSAFFPGEVGLVPFAAFAGSLAAVMLVLFISEKTGASRITLVLSGIAVSGIFSALTDTVLTFVPDALNGYTDFRIGGFSGLSMTKLSPAVWILLIAFVAIMSLCNELELLSLGSETASSLGMNVRLFRILLLSLAAALAGAAVSFSGLLGFVGLLVPHIMRSIVGQSGKELIPCCALGGAVLLTLCDLVSRTLFAPYELPVGIIMSLLGGPFFIWLLLRQRGGRLRD